MNFIKNLPIGFVASAMGSVTLANIYGTMGFPLIRHIFNVFGIVVVIMITIKKFMYHQKCVEEYNNTVLASIYPVYSMLIMLIGAYVTPYAFNIGKILWLIGITLHTWYIIVFLWKNVFRKFDYATFVPSWFVTCFGILVAVVVGKPYNMPLIMQILSYYGFMMLVLVYIPMVIRVAKDGIPEPLLHTRVIFLAPPALIVVSYINTFTPNHNLLIVLGIYFILMGALLYTIVGIPKYFSVPFTPGFAGLTFPMAIGTLAALIVSANLDKLYPVLGIIVKQIAGIQFTLTTVFIYVVLFNFFKMFKDSKS